ncbi:MmcQ/YjbR family DNA-binding protein [Williamsia sp. 1135]|uniref:MmcQ/YjbR family DNA-binding protein n=1 Tax=Williamsia sp. 1135 TaxID=1889262 RepID=UPI00197E6F33|nr:MmcQ/YjbR family DNA-binding protein [Williamsia sp. 1135]
MDDAGDTGTDDRSQPAFDEVVELLHGRALALPEAYSEAAWVGVRWRVRGRTFAHVLDIIDSHPPSYSKAASTAGPAIVLMFRSTGDELEALRHAGAPYFPTPWRRDEVGLLIASDTDWTEITELVTESYRLLAPPTLGARL